VFWYSLDCWSETSVYVDLMAPESESTLNDYPHSMKESRAILVGLPPVCPSLCPLLPS